MDKEQSFPAEADSYEFIHQSDARSIRSDSSDVSSADSGIPLSDAEKALADRVRHLKQENKEIRLAIENYQEALQLCEEKLNSVVGEHDVMVSRMQQYYKQAKTKVERQNQKISDLEKQLQEEKNKDSPHIEENQANKQQNEKNDCEKLDVLKKSNLKENVCSLHQLVGNLSGLTLDELHTSISADLLQDLINLNEDIEKSIKPLLKSNHPAPVLNALEEELKLVKEQLKCEKEKQAELESKITKLQGHSDRKQIEGVDVQDVQEELKLLDRDMDKMDMLRAGFVSRDSQTTEGSFSIDQRGEEQGINDSLDISKYEAEIVELKEQINKQKKTFDKRETAFLTKEETLLKEKKDLEKQLSEMKIKLDEKVDGSQLLEIQAEKSQIQERLQEQIAMCEAIQNELDVSLAANNDLETELKENYSVHLQELKKKEDIENDLKARVFSFYQDLQAKDLECEELKASHEMEYHKMGSALEEMRKELAAVYSENEKLLTERKDASEAEIADSQSKIDNLTAQLLSAEEMLEHKETDIRKLQACEKGLLSELESIPLLKQQLDVFQTDFNTERQTREKVEDDNKKLRNEVGKLQAENERLKEEANDPTGSRLLEMQRRHGCGNNMPAGNDSPWSGFYDQYLAPRGPPAARNNPHQPPADNDINRQVSGGRCPKCDRDFPDLDKLQTHVVECLESESSESVGRKICPKCQGSFPDLDTLQIHVMECLDDI